MHQPDALFIVERKSIGMPRGNHSDIANVEAADALLFNLVARHDILDLSKVSNNDAVLAEAIWQTSHVSIIVVPSKDGDF